MTEIEPGASDVPGTPRETKGERTRKSIIEAAIVRFARDGYRQASLTGIARDVGLSPSAIYPYFGDKEALFVAAVDEDAAGEIEDGLAAVSGEQLIGDWSQVMVGLLGALERHPLARRVLAGLEPDFTVRLIGIPALEELRKGLAANIEALQITGQVRLDADPQAMARGLVTISLSLLMSLVQTGSGTIDLVGEDVAAVLDTTLRPPRGPVS
jgi:AcrR family transcriptional regulator